MAEYSKEKLFFVKLPSDFFQGHRMRILEAIPSGKEYELIYLKLICESVSHNGYLRFSEDTPYTPEMIAAITGATVSEVNGALMALEKLELIQKTDNESIFIPAVPTMTGSTTEGAQRKQEQLARRKQSGSEGENLPPEIRVKRLENRLETTDYTNVSSSVSLTKTHKNTQKQNALCWTLVEFGYIREEELQDPDWNDLFEGYIQKYGFKDTKIKLHYFLTNTCRLERKEDDEGYPVFQKVYIKDHKPIGNRYTYLKAAMDESFKRFGGEEE